MKIFIYKKSTENSYNVLDYNMGDRFRIDQEWLRSRDGYELSLLIQCTQGDSTHRFIRDSFDRTATYEYHNERPPGYYRFKLNLSKQDMVERFYLQISKMNEFIKHDTTEFEIIMEQVGVTSLVEKRLLEVEKRLLEVMQADKNAQYKYSQALAIAASGDNFIKVVEIGIAKYFIAQQEQTESTLAVVDATRFSRAKSYNAYIADGSNYKSWAAAFIQKVDEFLTYTDKEVLQSATLKPEVITMWFNATNALAGMLSMLNEKHACPEIIQAIQRVQIVALKLGLKSPKGIDPELVSNLMQCVTAHIVNDSKLQQFDKFAGVDSTTVFMLLQVIASQNAELAKRKLIGTEKLAEVTINRAAGIIQRKFRQLLPRQYAKYCQTYAQQVTRLTNARNDYTTSHEASLLITPTTEQVLAHTGLMEQYASARSNLETYATPKTKYPFTAKAMLSLFSGKQGSDQVNSQLVEQQQKRGCVACAVM